VRGDIFANETKSAKEPISVMAQLHLLVSREAAPEVRAAARRVARLSLLVACRVLGSGCACGCRGVE
jgi:hypothetical protein